MITLKPQPELRHSLKQKKYMIFIQESLTRIYIIYAP